MDEWKEAAQLFLLNIKLSSKLDNSDSSLFSPFYNTKDKCETPPFSSKNFAKFRQLRSLRDHDSSESRIIYTVDGCIFAISSSILLQDLQRKVKEKRLVRDRTESFGFLIAKEDDFSSRYDPFFLDDPELTFGKHKVIITLPSFVVNILVILQSSIIQFSKLSELKTEINVKFKQLNYDIDPQLTLTQIRSVKLRLLKVALENNIELATVAKSFVYFEKLILKKVVVKSNRRLYGAICLFLSCKVNDIKELVYSTVLKSLGDHLDTSKNEILSNEFRVFVDLEFKLHILEEEYLPHFERIFSSLDFSNIQEYLGEKMYHLWISRSSLL